MLRIKNIFYYKFKLLFYINSFLLTLVNIILLYDYFDFLFLFFFIFNLFFSINNNQIYSISIHAFGIKKNLILWMSLFAYQIFASELWSKINVN